MTENLDEKLERAKAKAARARSALAKLERRMDSESRKRRSQRLFVLGAAAEELGRTNASFRESFSRYLRGFVSRDTDRASLVGTPFEIAVPAAAELTEGGTHEAL